MLDNKRKKHYLTLYKTNHKNADLFKGYDFGEEESEFMNTNIGKAVVSKMGRVIQGKELVMIPPKRAMKQRNNDLPPSSSNSLNEMHDEQREMNESINKLIKIIEKRNLIYPMASSEDDNDD